MRFMRGKGTTMSEEEIKVKEKQNVDLELLEQPVAAHDLNGLKQVKESTYIPIEADESAYSLSQVQKILEFV